MMVKCHDSQPLAAVNIAREYTLNLNWSLKCDGKVIFTRPFLMLDKVTFDDHVHALKRYRKDILYTLTKPLWVSFQI